MISAAYYKIQELLLCAVIISLPLMRIPDQGTPYFFHGEIICQWYFCSFPFYYLLLYSIWNKKTGVPFKTYFSISVVWIVFCTILGVFFLFLL